MKRFRHHPDDLTPEQRERMRLLSKVERFGECWFWVGAISDTGYGNAYYKGRMQPAHRAIYKLLVGAIPDGHELDHLCRVRPCVNPAHLEAVTPRVNQSRGMSPSAVAVRTNRCQRGHELTFENTIVRVNGKRGCRTCWYARNAAYMRRRRAAV